MIKSRISPRHEAVNKIRARILSGEWAPGALLPSIRELADEYRCAPNTMHAALRDLAAEGVIVLRDRKGAIVALPTQSIAGRHERVARSEAGGLFRPTEAPEMLRVSLVTEAPPDALIAFGLPDGSEIGLREYLVRVDGTVVTYGTSYIHPHLWGQVAELRAPAPIPDGIIGAVHRTLGRKIASVPGPVKADFAQPDEAAHLGVPEDSPILVELTSCIAEDGGLIEWSMQVHRPRYWIGQ